MGKAPKLYRKVDPGDTYKYAEIQILEDEYASIGVDISDGGLTVWSQGARTDNVRVSAKKVRKFARTLLALADLVDPPAPKTKYWYVNSTYYRRVAEGSLEVLNWDGDHWMPALHSVPESYSNYYDWRVITADELPAGAAA